MKLEDVKKDPEMKEMHAVFTNAIYKAIAAGPCIIHEKEATDLLKDREDVLKVMLYNFEHKISRAIADGAYNTDGMSEDELISFIKREDRKRAHYHDAVSTTKWGDRNTYDLLMDSDVLSREKCAEILIEVCSAVSIDSAEAAKIISANVRWSKDVDVTNLG